MTRKQYIEFSISKSITFIQDHKRINHIPARIVPEIHPFSWGDFKLSKMEILYCIRETTKGVMNYPTGVMG